ncbi:MAG: DsrE family protein [Campylobacterota bacterium]|nr:DsrE family protein [Campylobacterota bacterium]
MRKIILVILISVFAFAEMEFADPQPTFDNPRKWVIKLRTDDPLTVNHLLSSIYNVLAEYPSDAINITVVTYASGVRVLRKDYVNTVATTRIKSLMQYDVEFISCRNTMKTMKWKEDEFIDDIGYVQAGIVEIIEKVTAGYIEVTPY